MARDPDALNLPKWDAPDADATEPAAARIASGYDQPFSRQGGPLPPREDFNFYRRALSALGTELNETGLLEWDAGTTYRHDASGGAAVMRNNGIYISLQESTNIDPAAAGGDTYWARIYTKAEVDTLLAAINTAIANLGVGDLTRAVADTLYLALANAGSAATVDTGTDEDDIPVLGTGGVLDADRLPDASTTQEGVVELATNAEAGAGTDTGRAITPSSFRSAGDARYARTSQLGTAATEDTGTASGDIPVLGASGELASARLPDASTTAKGGVELATNSETETGTNATRAVTPAGFRAAGDARYVRPSDLGTAAAEDTGTASGDIPVLGANGELDEDRLPAATTNAKGAVELATNAETTTGTDAERAVTPAAFRAAGDARYLTETAGDARYVQASGSIEESGSMMLSVWSDLLDTAFGSDNGFYPAIGVFEDLAVMDTRDSVLGLTRTANFWRIIGYNSQNNSVGILTTVNHTSTGLLNIRIKISTFE